jgi:hypothetical protein
VRAQNGFKWLRKILEFSGTQKRIIGFQKKVKEFLEQLRKYKCLFVRRQEHMTITKLYLRKISLVWTYESREKSLILSGTRKFSLFWGSHSLLFAVYRGRD